jgi:shikimate dehydrogenase
LEAGPASVTIANRTLSKARELAEHFADAGPVSAYRFSEVPRGVGFSLIINATSAGLAGEIPPYPASAIGENCLCYDLSYGLTPTPFSHWAVKHGAARSVMGWGMLVEQAAESFHLWRGVRPNTEAVLKQLSINA